MLRLSFAVIVAVSSAALGNSFETFGFGPRAQALGGALVANSPDYTASFYNPAMLARVQAAQMGLNYSFHRLEATVRPLSGDRTLDCTYCRSPDALGASIGFALPLGSKLKDRVGIGAGIHLPTERLLRLQSPDVEQPFWLLQQSSPERFMLFAGVGAKLTEDFSVGVGMQALANLVGRGATLNLDLFSRRVTRRDLDATVETRVAPTAGLQWSPSRSFRLGLSYRGEIAMKYRIPASISIDGVAAIAFAIDGIAHYSPQTVTAGLAWDLSENWTVMLDGQWMNWSQAPNLYARVGLDLSGDTLAALGLDEGFDVATVNQANGFQDTVNGRLGLEFRPSERLAFRAGAMVRPTPVPRQDVPGTNILDGTWLLGSLGMGVGFEDPLQVFERLLFFEVSAQGGTMLAREARKDVTDRLPSYSYSAIPWGATAALRYEF